MYWDMRECVGMSGYVGIKELRSTKAYGNTFEHMGMFRDVRGCAGMRRAVTCEDVLGMLEDGSTMVSSNIGGERRAGW